MRCLRTGASLSSSAASVIAFSIARAARSRLTIRHVMTAPTIRKMTAMIESRTPVPSSGA